MLFFHEYRVSRHLPAVAGEPEETHKIFFPFFAQEINIAKDILVKPALARLASARARQDGVWDEDGTVAVARLVSVAFIVNRFRRTQPKDVIRNEYRNR